VTYAPGTIGLSRISGAVGVFVRWGQWLTGDGSPWTHAFVVLDDAWVIEAAPGGIRMVEVGSYESRAAFLPDWPVLSADQQQQLVQEARKMLGAQYGWMQYPALALLALGLKPYFLRHYVARSDRYICSQLVDELHRRVGSQLFDDGRESMDVTPGDLARRYRQVTGTEPKTSVISS